MEHEIDYMSTYSIKDLENLSGIKAHTIRIWEQRYGIVEPKRTPTNIRYYDSADLKLILKVAMLRRHGIKISKIAAMSEEEINQEVAKIGGNEENSDQNYVFLLTNAMLELDEPLFERTLSTCILQMGLEETMYEVIQPFLIKIGYLWQTDSINPAQEHFITCLLRQKLIVAIDGQTSVDLDHGERFVLYLPEGELHEITLLFACYVIKKAGHKVIYLGQNLPFEDVKSVYQIYDPQYILSIFTSFPKQNLMQQYINDLSEACPSTKILLSGFAVLHSKVKLPANVTLLEKLDDIHKSLPEKQSVVAD